MNRSRKRPAPTPRPPLPHPEIGAWGLLLFYALLPHVFAVTAMDNFRLPKDAFAAGFILLLAGHFVLTRRFVPRRRPAAWTLLLWGGLLYLFVHCLWAGREDLSWPAFGYVLLFCLLLLMLRRLPGRAWLQRIWLALGISLSLAALLGVLESLGWFPLLERRTGQLLSGRVTPAGFIGDVNSGGFLFGLAALISLYGVMVERHAKLRLVWLGVLLANLTGLAFTRTLTALGATTACLAGWLLFHHWWTWKHKGRLGREIAILWVGLLVLGLAGAAVGWRAGVAQRVQTVASQMARGDWNVATAGRQPVFGITWEMIKERPLTGRGLQSFPQDFFHVRSGTDYGRQAVLINQPGAFRQVHNEYLQIWVELGVAALLIFLLLWLWPLARAVRRALGTTDPEESYWLALQALAAVFVLISCLTFFPLHVSSTAAVAMLVLAGLERGAFGERFEGRTLAQLLEGRPLLLWGARAPVVLAALAMAVPLSLLQWQANRELGIAAVTLEEARSSPDPRRRRFLAEQAAGRLDRAHERAPYLTDYYNLRGSACMLLGRHQEARDYYSEAARKLPSPEVYTNLAAAHISSREYEPARRYLSTALLYNPAYEPARDALEYLEKVE